MAVNCDLFTDTPSYTSIRATAIKTFVSRHETYSHMANSLSYNERYDPHSMAIVQTLVGEFFASLPREHKDAEVKTTKVREAGNVVKVAKRTIDHLWLFLGAAIPYFMKYVQYDEIETGVVEHVTNKHYTHHYHLIPKDLMDSKRHVEFISWDADGHYDGLPGEWEAMKKLHEAAASPVPQDGNVYRLMMYINEVQRAAAGVDRCRRNT